MYIKRKSRQNNRRRAVALSRGDRKINLTGMSMVHSKARCMTTNFAKEVKKNLEGDAYLEKGEIF